MVKPKFFSNLTYINQMRVQKHTHTQSQTDNHELALWHTRTERTESCRATEQGNKHTERGIFFFNFKIV